MRPELHEGFPTHRCRDEGRIGSKSLGSILNKQEDRPLIDDLAQD
jgi:hypothetical protein